MTRNTLVTLLVFMLSWHVSAAPAQSTLHMHAKPHHEAPTSRESRETYLAPGWGQLAFKAPSPGSYTLPVIGNAADGAVLDTKNERVQLHDLMGDKVTILSFIYSACSDVNGCPLATAVFHRIAKRLQQDVPLQKKLRLLTLSFDSVNDTPQVMAEYAASIRQQRTADWRFLTTESEASLAPILQDYQQSIIKEVSPHPGVETRFSHILRVYLIDKQKQIRNIYSVSFLHPDILMNDVKTLLMEEPALAQTHR